VITPPWENVTNNEKIIIRIEPNMAFGTGTHETTQLCIAEIDKHLRSGESFFDVGTGTGILAIAAARLGSEAILACDTDSDSIKIAKENAELNGVAEKIEFYVGSITAAVPLYDFVCANLTIDVILPILDLLIDRSRRILLLSGILSEQESMIADALTERGISSLAVSRRGEWISVLVVRS
jgi:ribosomal protein L11 methyltransferase